MQKRVVDGLVAADRRGVFEVREVEGGVNVQARPWLSGAEVRAYFGGMSDRYWTEFRKRCPATLRRPDRWHIEDLLRFEQRKRRGNW